MNGTTSVGFCKTLCRTVPSLAVGKGSLHAAALVPSNESPRYMCSPVMRGGMLENDVAVFCN